MNDEDLRDQINSLIRDEIQENINDYVDSVEETKKAGLGFVSADDDKELKVKVSQREIDKIIKEYKKMKKGERSNLSQIKKLGLVDKNGKPLS
jgi:2,4-dienoyl-CoA reductase-like NADH-dependent reductase (Old Yellow Enzyme family)|tara:strand:- start:414 stop:692 length:279 start_codon:yes stop_codon:yes gene_type:complete